MSSTQDEFTLPLRPRDAATNTLSNAQDEETGLVNDQEDDPTKHHVNFSNHPNVSGLPGFDFAVGDGVPILNRRYSGLFRLIALPRDEFSKPHSAEGIKAIASRLHAVFQVAIRTYEMKVGVPTIRNLWLYTFQELRPSDKSWDFEVSHKKVPVIMRKITTLIPAEFFDFLHTIDDFIYRIESTFQTNVSKHLKKKRSRDESDDETEEIQNTMKKARIVHAYEDIEKMAQEEQIRYWKEKALGLKGKLEAQDEVVKGLHKLLHEMKNRKNRSSLEFNYCVTRLWDDALPGINEKQRQQGQMEWASSQLQEYLRATGSSRIADAMLGVGDFDEDHM
ncbi:hypothetical protein CSIM01_06640 [Colletotrichum simmondsii]|uniref:Uncharacterized protein n=1 Tax=Colletotrichum simmondsii TaxID=703756 RepID=A0A135SUQ9_9PEZI|nr:hypothetical protein CSIM01_06640 [Colletotrichum simmondsii]